MYDLNVLEAKPIYATVSWSDFISVLHTIDLIFGVKPYRNPTYRNH